MRRGKRHGGDNCDDGFRASVGRREDQVSKEIEAAGGLAAALKQAVANSDAARVKVVYIGPKPDLLRHEAQAIVTGKLGADGVFHADELLLKCPTRYEEQAPAQASGG